ncbi:unnamed protein product [Aureobasidium vineae]|uniref:Uncharacterized protein n=1 Tax=Aureobasidium vineae TaxID=2773715 RepID=A0A9N8J8X3_9PEZI|nr:unnamed protein product [Aureobasidium vineae]
MSTTTNPASSSSSVTVINRFTYEDASTNDTATNATTFTPNKPFYLQSLCTSGLQISGLYAALISTNSNPALQFTTSASLASRFYLSTSGYLYVMPSSSTPWTSFSDEMLMANIDQGATDMDFFFNEEAEIAAMGAEKAKCGVDDDDGVLQLL